MHILNKYLLLLCVHCMMVVTTVNANTLETAYELGGFDATFNKSYPGTEQWYYFESKAEEGVTITLTPHIASSSLLCTLYDASGTIIAVSGFANDGELVTISAQLHRTAKYYLKISGSASGGVDLTVYSAWYNAGVIDAQRDFYSSYETARQLTNTTYPRAENQLGETISDYYRFSAQSGDHLNISLTAHLASGDLMFNLRDAFGNILSASARLGDGETKYIEKTLYKDGLYYLEVSGNGKGTYDLFFTGIAPELDADGDGLTTAAEYYHRTDPLKSDTDGGGANDFQELIYGGSPLAVSSFLDADVGESLAAASSLPYMNQPINAEYIGTGGTNEHWYSFNLNEGEGVTVALEAHLNVYSLRGTFYHSSGSIISATDFADNGDLVTTSYKVPAQEGGTYYLKISGSAFGNYNLTVYNAWYDDGSTDNQRDFYSSYETARLLVNGTYTVPVMPGGVSMSTYYRFSAQSGDVLNVSISARLHLYSISGTLYDENQILIATTGSIDDGATRSLNIVIGSSGTYFLGVAGTGKGEYDLDGIPQNDFDNDGLMDDQEISLGTDPTNPDSDGDGLSDYQEVGAGTDPLDKNSKICHWPMFMPAIIGR